MGNYVSGIFGASPVAPLQGHMEQCYKAAKELSPFFTAVTHNDWAAATVHREAIVTLENQADVSKAQIRANLPKSLFMPVAREDLLELVLVQDRIPNLARDISGLVIGRKMQIPVDMQISFLGFVSRNIDAARKARKTIRELDELYETGFRGTELELVTSFIAELDEVENDTDRLQMKLRDQLFVLEADLPPVNVMFLYRVIELIGEIGDQAERIGRRLELIISH
ncbi:MAG: TIGR00153 family protein [Gammaproteobacteria bacterium]|nr:TIGR00153 family protein [Gammaproteobacteria bacterium]MCP4089585.1 TIGR00153 family protein [Gammaproteobacteria bacterium]MCP4278080.1 TIGR00153 family protein [Gammaproteobacteria bacterium]MCP4832476.1 TIGR00153 family protein [Gammaproteobacteria bacterium]MCP4930168.1 TIGR00153 family protein [Gammaproteobacteria bacterium]